MTEHTVVHATFRLERTYAAPPARVFRAFADRAAKRRWSVDRPGSELEEFSAEFAVGGHEASRFRFTAQVPEAPPPGTSMGRDTVYLDVQADRRIVFAYTMLVAGRRTSSSLATVELHPSSEGTRLVLTEQAAFFHDADGPERRKGTWRALLDRLDQELGCGASVAHV